MLTIHTTAKNTAKTGIVHLLRLFRRHFIIFLAFMRLYFTIKRKIYLSMVHIYMSISSFVRLLHEFVYLHLMYVSVLLIPIAIALPSLMSSAINNLR